MPFVKAIAKSDLQPGQGKCVELQGQKIAIFNVAGRFVAIEDTCSHDEASLSEGGVIEQEDGKCVVECPWHGAHFDLFTGAALTLPAVRPIKTYVVRQDGESVEVEL